MNAEIVCLPGSDATKYANGCLDSPHFLSPSPTSDVLAATGADLNLWPAFVLVVIAVGISLVVIGWAFTHRTERRR